jgi:hypothetical protein
MNYFKKTTVVELVDKPRLLDGSTDEDEIAVAVVLIVTT